MNQTSAPSGSTPLAFHKMVGAGNDFVVIDARRRPFAPDPALVRRLADRRAGIGCDQLLAIEHDPAGDAAFVYRVWNADGGEVEQCGNGARCLAWLWSTELEPGATAFRMRSTAGPVEARVAEGAAAVSMGEPDFVPARIPMTAQAMTAPDESLRYTIELAGRNVHVGAVSMGNPHAVIDLAELGGSDIGSAPVTTLGPAIETHPAFPRGANVGFAQVMTRDRIALRVWERGCGETQACGTGACAAVAILRDRDALDSVVRVDLPGGSLGVEWQGRGTPAWLSGPSAKVFEGTIKL